MPLGGAVMPVCFSLQSGSPVREDGLLREALGFDVDERKGTMGRLGGGFWAGVCWYVRLGTAVMLTGSDSPLRDGRPSFLAALAMGPPPTVISAVLSHGDVVFLSSPAAFVIVSADGRLLDSRHLRFPPPPFADCYSSEVPAKPESSSKSFGYQKSFPEEKRAPPGEIMQLEMDELSSLRGPTVMEIISTVPVRPNVPVRELDPVITPRGFCVLGLTDEEVEMAIQRSGSAQETLTVSPAGPALTLQHAPLVPAPYGPPGYRWRDYGALAIIIAGMAFGVHHLYRKYILPLIMGSREDKEHLRRISSSMAEMSGTLAQTVTQLQTTLASVQELLVQQQKKIQELSQELASSQALHGWLEMEDVIVLLCSVCNAVIRSNSVDTGLACSTTNRMVESQSISELKAEIASLKGLLLSRRQFPSSPSLPKIPSWQISLKPGTTSNSPSANHTNSSSDISPVSNESASSSPIKEGHSSQATPPGPHGLNGEVALGAMLPLDLKSQVRMEVQGEEERREEEDGEEEEEEEEEEEDDDDDVSRADEEERLGVQSEDRRGGDGQFNEQVEKLRRPEGASNESEVD
ncbi:hypothetical protein P4O66_022498 [Electrophorus voltai]|uniref:Peroxisomal membrane protein PEX14 n=1 Tax=Electrophorus voltai TaxID=2609070 RepID=A0AAD8ZM50_9TELE|nr:hypothetical protein P4O66_022498 [Electrophorus voltai]